MLFGYFLYISEVLGYNPAMSSYMYSVVDISKVQHVKSKFKVFHKISVLFGCFSYISQVMGYNLAISSYMYSVVYTSEKTF